MSKELIMFVRGSHFLTLFFLMSCHFVQGQLSFTEVQTPTSTEIMKVHFTNEHDGWAFTGLGEILKSNDEGESWEIVYDGDSTYFWSMSWADENHGWFSGPESFVRTKNGGLTWEEIPLMLPTDYYDAIFFLDSMVGFLGLYRDPPNYEFNVYKTVDGGDSWSPLNYTLPGSVFENFDFIDENYGWVATNGAVSYTADGGVTWTQSYTGSAEVYRWIDIIDMSQAWVATDSGEVRWTSDATNWLYSDLTQFDDIEQVQMLNSSFGACVGEYDGFWLFQSGAWTQVLGIANGTDLNGVFIESESSMWLCGGNGKIYRGQVTPTDARMYPLDLPDTICAETDVNVLVEVINESDYAIYNFDIKIYLDDVFHSITPWSGLLNPSEDVIIDLGDVTFTGANEMKLLLIGDSITFDNEIIYQPVFLSDDSTGVVSPIIACSGETITLEAFGGESYLWYQAAPDGENILGDSQQEVEAGTIGQYHVLIQQEYCSFEDSILIDFSGCSQVTAFSPNGDHVNDFLFIDNLDLNADNTVIIYNRWGDEVKRFSNYDNEENVWYGNSRFGASLGAGTYYYVVSSSNASNSFTSWVQILR